MHPHKDKKMSCHGTVHGIVLWLIVILLSSILLVLVFKAGMMAGGSRSHFSSYKNKEYVMQQYEAKAEAKGMTMEEYKAYLIELKK